MKKIIAVVLDVDGVLTDGSFIWGPGEEEYKKFSFIDIMGISLGMRSGLVFALISGEDSSLVDRLARKMGIADVYKGCKDKALALRNFAQKHNLDMQQVCFMGDDVNDLAALELAGLSAVPSNGHKSCRRKAKILTKCAGGQGAVRELVDLILSSKNRKA